METVEGYLRKDPKTMFTPDGEKTIRFRLVTHDFAEEINCKTILTQTACTFLHEGDWVKVRGRSASHCKDPTGWWVTPPLIAERIDFLYTGENVAPEIREMFDSGVIYTPVKTF